MDIKSSENICSVHSFSEIENKVLFEAQERYQKINVEKQEKEIEKIQKKIDEITKSLLICQNHLFESTIRNRSVWQKKEKNLKNSMLELETKKKMISEKNYSDDFYDLEDEVESPRAKRIRIGEITPFDSIQGIEKTIQNEDNTSLSSQNIINHDDETFNKEEQDFNCLFEITNDDMINLDSEDNEDNEDNEIKVDNCASNHLVDDSDTKIYQNRLKINQHLSTIESVIDFEGGLKIPQYIFEKLFNYQQTGVKWLWELHCQNIGGIICDEMGLGKTLQVVTFFAGLHYSNLLKSSLIVCPASVMGHWLEEFHRWYPPIRVLFLHEINFRHLSNEEIIDILFSGPYIAISTYETIRNISSSLLSREWGYIILDEGHKIRNPNSEISLMVKQFLTQHRIIMSGCPIQNNLKELWSLFDFIFPGKLGRKKFTKCTLPVFEEEICQPIHRGGFTNCSLTQAIYAYQCAENIRNLISPYILRRVKTDVQHKLNLPSKHEQILLCKLTPIQKELYLNYLQSNDMKRVLQRRGNAFHAITHLRKICNHPDLLFRQKESFTSFLLDNDNIMDDPQSSR